MLPAPGVALKGVPSPPPESSQSCWGSVTTSLMTTRGQDWPVSAWATMGPGGRCRSI